MEETEDCGQWVQQGASERGLACWAVFRKETAMKVKVFVAQSYLALYDPMDCSLPGSSVPGILQARILEWVANPFSRGSSWPKDWTLISCFACRFFPIWATREAPQEYGSSSRNNCEVCGEEEGQRLLPHFHWWCPGQGVGAEVPPEQADSRVNPCSVGRQLFAGDFMMSFYKTFWTYSRVFSPTVFMSSGSGEQKEWVR